MFIHLITAVEIFNQLHGVHIMPLVINSLGRGHTHTHTDDPHRINFKNQACAGLSGLKTS